MENTEIGVFQNFFYITVQLLRTIAQNARKILLTEFIVLQSCIPLDRQLFQRRYKVYVKSHRHRIVVKTTSCVHVVNSESLSQNNYLITLQF